MTANTSRGYTYPQSTDHNRLWEHFQELANDINTDVDTIFTAGTSYTPVFTTGSGTPSLGTGGIARGRYKKIGRTVHLNVYALFGTSPNFGTGGFFLSAPFAAATVTDMTWNGSAYFRDLSAGGSGHFSGYCRIDSAASVVQFYGGGSSVAQVSSANPFAWAAGDFIRGSLTYESAA